MLEQRGWIIQSCLNSTHTHTPTEHGSLLKLPPAPNSPSHTLGNSVSHGKLSVFTQTTRANQLTKGLKCPLEQAANHARAKRVLPWGFLNCVLPSVKSKRKKVNKTRRKAGGSTHLLSRVNGDRKRAFSSSWLLCRLLCWLLCWLLQDTREDEDEQSELCHTKCLFHFMLPRKAFK